jgi:uncharacterized lipoprotein YddW (UPF0748 family)
MKISHILLIVFGFCLTVCWSIIPLNTIVTANTAIQHKTSEIRGVWLTNVDSDVLFSSANTKQAVDRLADMNFNTLYPTVWQGGYTLYPSQVAEKTFGVKIDPTPGLQQRDMLEEIIKEGHAKGLKVIPWFEFGFMAPANSQLARQHPDWLTKQRNGELVKMEGIEPRVWLNPLHPEVQKFIIDLVVEIVSNYDVDGIQFDDHFGLPAEYGYDDLTVQTYTKELKGLKPSDDYKETFWVRWRADKINQVMEKVFYAVKAVKPKCIISVSPNPLHFALPAYLQDWFTWERKGFIEELVLQVYRSDLDRFRWELQRAEVILAKSHIPVAIGILSGLRNQGVPINTIEKQVDIVRQEGFAGVGFFFYESLWHWSDDPASARLTGLKNLFPVSVSRPEVLVN